MLQENEQNSDEKGREVEETPSVNKGRENGRNK